MFSLFIFLAKTINADDARTHAQYFDTLERLNHKIKHGIHRFADMHCMTLAMET